MKIKIEKIEDKQLSKDEIEILIKSPVLNEHVEKLALYISQYEKNNDSKVLVNCNNTIKEISYDDIICFYSDKKYNYCKTIDECFDRYLIPIYDKTRKVKKGISLEEGTELIHKAGGVTSLAHPNSLKHSREEFASLMPYFVSLGINSLETKHPNLTPEERAFYHEMAIKYHLLESGGTDYHGIEIKPDIELATGRNNDIYIEENSLTLTKKIKNRYM